MNASLIIKSITLSLTMVISSLWMMAQDEPPVPPVAQRPAVPVQIDTLDGPSDPPDTTRISLGKREITIITSADDGFMEIPSGPDKSKSRKASLTWWNGIDLGVNGIMNSDYGFDLAEGFEYLEPRYGNSRYISFNFAAVKARIISDYVGITSGLTFQFYNFNYSGSNNMVFGDSLAAFPSGERNVSKNKFRVGYLGVPLLLEFNTSLNSSRSFHISAGVIGKLRIDNMYKQKFSENDSDFKTTQKGHLGLNRWGADAIVRVGYGWFTLFAQTGLVPLFDNDNAPDMQTFAAGIAFTFH